MPIQLNLLQVIFNFAKWQRLIKPPDSFRVAPLTDGSVAQKQELHLSKSKICSVHVIEKITPFQVCLHPKDDLDAKYKVVHCSCLVVLGYNLSATILVGFNEYLLRVFILLQPQSKW